MFDLRIAKSCRNGILLLQMLETRFDHGTQRRPGWEFLVEFLPRLSCALQFSCLLREESCKKEASRMLRIESENPRRQCMHLRAGRRSLLLCSKQTRRVLK